MSKLDNLVNECKSRAYWVQIEYNQNSDISIAIGTKYVSSDCEDIETPLYYIDGYINTKKAIKKALRWLDKND